MSAYAKYLRAKKATKPEELKLISERLTGLPLRDVDAAIAAFRKANAQFYFSYSSVVLLPINGGPPKTFFNLEMSKLRFYLYKFEQERTINLRSVGFTGVSEGSIHAAYASAVEKEFRRLQSVIIEYPDRFGLAERSRHTSRHALFMKFVRAFKYQDEFFMDDSNATITHKTFGVEYKGKMYDERINKFLVCAISGTRFMYGVDPHVTMNGMHVLKEELDKLAYLSFVPEADSYRFSSMPVDMPDFIRGLIERPRRSISTTENSNYSLDVLNTTEATFLLTPEDNHKVKGDTLFMGVELEVQTRPKAMKKAGFDKARLFDKIYSDFEIRDSVRTAVLKEDASLERSNYTTPTEIVTVPASYNYHRSTLWSKFFDAEKGHARFVRSFGEKGCGMHVHVNVSFFSQKQKEMILSFVHGKENSPLLSCIAGRDINYTTSYCKSYMMTTLDRYSERNMSEHTVAATISTRNGGRTLEFRIFRGNVKPSSFFKNLQFVQSLADYVKSIDPSITDNKTLDPIVMKPAAYIDYVKDNKHKFIELYNWLASHKFIDDPTVTPDVSTEDGAVHLSSCTPNIVDDTMEEGRNFYFKVSDIERTKTVKERLWSVYKNDDKAYLIIKASSDDKSYYLAYEGDEIDRTKALDYATAILVTKMVKPIRMQDFVLEYMKNIIANNIGENDTEYQTFGLSSGVFGTGALSAKKTWIEANGMDAYGFVKSFGSRANTFIAWYLDTFEEDDEQEAFDLDSVMA